MTAAVTHLRAAGSAVTVADAIETFVTSARDDGGDAPYEGAGAVELVDKSGR